MNKKDNYILLIIVIIILVSLLGIIYFSDKDKTLDDNNSKVIYKLVNDYSRFFTVNSCVYKYISYLSSKNTNSLLKVLDKEYIDSNNINENNIFDVLPNISGNYSFVSKKMYYNQVSDNYYIYYVYGYTEEDITDEIGHKEYYYFKVNFDQKNNTFSIVPIDSTFFEGVQNG